MRFVGLIVLGCSLLLCACVPQTIQVAPLVVEPIHMTVDVTIHESSNQGKPKGPAAEPGEK